MQLNFLVRGQQIKQTSVGNIASDSHYDIAGGVVFDAAWDGISNRYLTFEHESGQSINVYLRNNEFSETLDLSLAAGIWYVSAHGSNTEGRLIDTVPTELYVAKSGGQCCCSDPHIPPNVAAQIGAFAVEALQVAEKSYERAGAADKAAKAAIAAADTAEKAADDIRELVDDIKPEEVRKTMAEALSEAKESGEFDGEDGITPHIGSNENWYIGDEDTGKPARGEKGDTGDIGRSAYEIYVDNGGELSEEQWLSSLSAGTPKFVQSVDEMTDESMIYVMPDGHLWAYELFEGDGYTNQIPLSIDTDGSIFNGKGYKNDTRYNSSFNAVANSGSFITGSIPIKKGDVIRFGGDIFSGSNGALNSIVYKADMTDIVGFTPSIFATGAAGRNRFEPYEYDSETQTLSSMTINENDCKYIKFTFVGTGENAVVTVNEEIKTVKEYRWGDTGLTYTPADNDDRIVALEAKAKDTEVKLSKLEGEITTTDKDELPEYWKIAVDGLAGKMKERQKNGVSAFQFLWFSDMHGKVGYTNTNGAGKSDVTHIGAVSKYASDKYDIPFIATTGDIMSQGSDPSDSYVYQEYRDFWKIFSSMDIDKFLITIGNHDGSWGDPVNGIYHLKDIGNRALYNEIYRPQALDRTRVFGSDGTYYYVDNPQKVRIIMLDSNTDGDGSNDANGNAVYNSMKTSVYGSTQLAWLTEVLNSVPDGYTVIVMAHQPIPSSKDGALLVGILNAYNAKTTYSGSANASDTYWGSGLDSVTTENEYTRISVSCDFTKAKGEFTAFFYGHIHYDSINTTTYAFPMISITTAGADVRDTDPVERVPGTATETAMDIVTIDRAERKIYMTRLGAGVDREVGY